MRCIVSVAIGPHYVANQDRLLRQVGRLEQCIFFRDELPPGSPTHADSPYQFKIHAIEKAASHGAGMILWMDSSIVVLSPLEPLWQLIEKQGYWFSRNYDYTNGQFCSDEALAIMGTTREAAFRVPHCVAGCFGLDMRSKIATVFMAAWKDWAQKSAFKGDRGNLAGGDAHTYQGHRNDQAVASQIIADFGMTMTEPPEYFAEQGREQSDRTIVTVGR